MTVRHRRLVAAAAAAMIIGPVIAIAASADDGNAPKFLGVEIGPPVAVKAASSSGAATLTVAATVSDPSGVDRVVAGLYDPAGNLPDGRTVTLARTSGTAKNGTWTAKVTTKGSDAVGTWTLRAFAQDGAGNMSDPDRVFGTFRLTDPTRFAAFNVGPEPAAAGGKVVLSGRIERYTRNKGWIPYPGRKVKLEFRPSGSTAFAPVASLKSDAKGSFATKAAATFSRTGTWRMTYAGNSVRAGSVSGKDGVTVEPAS